MTPSSTLAFCATLGVAWTASSAVSAQEVNFGAIDDEASNMMHVRTGAEYAFVVGAGYTRIFHVAGRPLLLTGDLTVPWATFDLSDYRLRIGVMAPIVGRKRWKLAGRFTPTVRGLKNRVSRMTNVGIDVALVGGYYGSRGFLVGELGVDWAITTRVKHSAAYRSAVFEGARDGWYFNAGGNFYYGLVGGPSFGRFDLVLRVGQGRDIRADIQLLPFYATLALNARW